MTGQTGDFWDDFWSNLVNGEPADQFALSSFVSVESRGAFTVRLNADTFQERDERFEIRVYESVTDSALGRPALLSASFTVQDDDINGTARADNLVGRLRADHLGGYGGNDTLNGGAGADTLNGGAGADRMLGGLGNDIYIVDNAGDRVIELAGQGTDTVRSTVNFTLGANVENLVLLGNGDLAGTGNALSNSITGNAGDNILRGGLGADILNGGAGDDRLTGGLGADRLTGGAGADVFVFEHLLESRPMAAARDVIVDFNRAQGDRIDLSVIDANTTRAGDQAFSYIGSAAFSETAGELRAVRLNGALFVNGDVNGDGKADFSVQVNMAGPLLGTDFIL
ncbi:hypothetical protein PE067_08675 [Paracoccus sp. DMF-8]|uniref:calcium-binding protein n=1 Tax=Paracoccus sp. DMF-8 TaxID=3019445 RepID=UPI0023E8956F|nr:hypothetical protein [Paracoccus sp. DMF-8]MDF3606198.1 hypothetical protein [Paracoccus sp. DMF-8]